MNLRVIREPSRDGATLGSLYVNNVWQCWTLEDVIREQPGVQVAAWKVAHQTAIPAGRYRVVLTLSQRFGRVLPLLWGVPGFDGVRMHSGNTAADTEGCLLLGQDRQGATVQRSRVACEALFAQLAGVAPGEGIWISIENPPAVSVSPSPAVQQA